MFGVPCKGNSGVLTIYTNHPGGNLVRKPGAPNENIVQTHLNIALLNVF